MVDVKLVGYNGDLESLDEGGEFTPETISAAYARISRDSRDISELREDSRKGVEKARRSNKKIVFGLGHHSVAEHAIFNFDITGISRLALEELEERRIGCGYTEKSQRYIKMDGDYVVPALFKKNIYDCLSFCSVADAQNLFYSSNMDMLKEYFGGEFPDLSEREIENKAKEDARYSLGLATVGQIGVSFNGRTLEHAIRTMKYSDLAEVREISKMLYNEGKKVAPSLIILSDANEFEKQFGFPLKEDNFKFGKKNLEKICNEASGSENGYPKNYDDYFCEGDVRLVEHSNIDRNVIAALIHSNGGGGMNFAYNVADNLLRGKGNADEFMKKALKYVSEFDSLPREFEFGGDLKYEIILSASNFAQLKRHRIMTLLKQNYDAFLGYTIPDSIKNTGLEGDFKRVCDSSGMLFERFKDRYGDAAQYVLTNAHRRKVLVSVNPRELYHISRLREDEHAQWDIRKTAEDMLILAKKVAPITFMLSGGKSDFEEIRSKVYGDEDA